MSLTGGSWFNPNPALCMRGGVFVFGISVLSAFLRYSQSPPAATLNFN
jgi:hypothetical protein